MYLIFLMEKGRYLKGLVIWNIFGSRFLNHINIYKLLSIHESIYRPLYNPLFIYEIPESM